MKTSRREFIKLTTLVGGAADLAESTKQRRTDSTQVLAVSHDDRHLGTPGCGDLDVVAGDAEQLAGSECAKGVLGVRRFCQ